MESTMLNVLILEDSATQARFIARMFSDVGASVDTLTTAKEFGDALEQSDTQYDAVLIDVHFGDVSGLTLIAPFLTGWPDALVCMMTANKRDDYAVLAEAREIGAHFLLPKPFSRKDVTTFLVDVQQYQNTRHIRDHVIVIDDSAACCKIAERLLTSAGFRVSAFQDPLEAISHLSYDHVDIVLTDMNMPGTSGAELICLIRDVWNDVAILAMSGDARLASNAGADGYLPKPYSPQEIIRTVMNTLNAKRTFSLAS